jgi:hypothetical protein
MAEQEDVVRKVQGLWAKADHPNTGAAEREVFVKKARELMAKHAIDEMVLAEASSTDEAIVLADILLYTDEEGDNGQRALVPDQRVKLAHYIYTHSRCTGVLTWKPASVTADGKPQLSGRYLVIIGHKSDVDLVRLMFNGLAGDMIIAMSMEPTGHMKAAERNIFFVNFCDAYADRIDRRLAEVEQRVEEMAAESSLLPVLRDRRLAVHDKMKEMFPNTKPAREKRFAYDPAARERGTAAANKANIGASRNGVGGSKKELT